MRRAWGTACTAAPWTAYWPAGTTSPICFFSLEPLEPLSRLHRIFSLASQVVVELETHPVQADEYRFLRSGEVFRYVENLRIAPPSALQPA